ncbi:Poly glycohydrolase [Cercophora samala]|uniref:poly(ADP-ribose) glycohydrolase n=1 Tax=Cercophora samala TaxID=330535 RepID=A0AA39ZAW3_9PEZI|nr:Poly glycohydrolase [Cercophora samala]
MPGLFPDGRIPVLNSENSSLRFSRRQVACLVVHQFLRTLSVPSWRDDDGTHDFGIWYSSQQRHPDAVRAYLRALMLYFRDVVCEDVQMEDWVVEYSLHSLPERYEEIAAEDRPLSELKVLVVERYDTRPASLGVGDGDGQAVVISANKVVGFGQSATQEEVHVGISPEACPIVLFTPPLGDEQVLKVCGAQAMVNIVGKGRDISVGDFEIPQRDSDTAWKFRTMLFMDALELDLEHDGERLADLTLENMERETAKAYTAFCSTTLSEIHTGLWGCGAFGGDPEVKMLLLWLAASMAGLKLTVVCDNELQTFAQELEAVGQMLKHIMSGTVSMKKGLMEIPQTLSRGQTLDWLKKRSQLDS